MLTKEQKGMFDAISEIAQKNRELQHRIDGLCFDMLAGKRVKLLTEPKIIVNGMTVRAVALERDVNTSGDDVIVAYRQLGDTEYVYLSELSFDMQIVLLEALAEMYAKSKTYFVISSYMQVAFIDANSKEEAESKARQKVLSSIQGADIDVNIFEA